MEDLRNAIEQFCEDNDFDFRARYSGRCMFGEECVGIVTPQFTDPLGVLIDLTSYLMDEVDDFNPSDIGKPRMDNMGLGMILYFPKIK